MRDQGCFTVTVPGKAPKHGVPISNLKDAPGDKLKMHFAEEMRGN